MNNDYYLTEKWARIRSLVIEREKSHCGLCGEYCHGLEVHHIHYGNFGNEKLSDLIALCPKCHRYVHSTREGKKLWKPIFLLTGEYEIVECPTCRKTIRYCKGEGKPVFCPHCTFRLTPVVGDAASPPASGEQTRTSGKDGEGSAPHPPRA